MAFVRKPIPSFSPPSPKPIRHASIKDRPLPPPPISEDRYVRSPESRSGRSERPRRDDYQRRPAERSYVDDRVAHRDNPHNYHHNPPHYKPSLKEDRRHYKKYQSEKKCSNPLTACSNAIVGGLETFFYWLGYFIAKRPYIAIIITLLLVGGFGSGVRNLTQVTEGAKLWTPSDSEAQGDLTRVNAWFPERRRISNFIVRADDNILTREGLRAMADIEDKVTKINASNTFFNDVCLRVGPRCLRRSILEVWGNNLVTVRSLPTDTKIINDLHHKITSDPNFDVTKYLSGIQRDSNNKIIKATHAMMLYALEASENEQQKKSAEAWEEKFLGVGEEGQKNVTVYRFAFRSRRDEGGGAIFGDIILLSCGYAILLAFVLVVLGRFNQIEHKFYISLVGISCVIFALGVSVGIGSYAELLFSPLNNILPFLLLGLGVDDMFVIVSALDNLPTPLKTASVPERIGAALKSAGVSITVTSLTDMLAFGMGIITTLPALRSFCTYCLMGILFTFVFQATYFVAWLSIDERRADAHRDACCFCVRVKKWEPNECSKILVVKRFFRGFYSKMITTVAAKVIVILISLGLLAFGIYGTYNLEQASVWTKFIPEDSYARAYLEIADQHFSSDASSIAASVYLGDIDYYGNFSKLEDLHINLKNTEWIDGDTVDTWWYSYRKWLNTTQSNTITSQLDTNKNPKDEDTFYKLLFETFLNSPGNGKFKSHINETNGRILYSRGEFHHINLTGSRSQIKAMDTARDVVTQTGIPREQAFAFTVRYLVYEGEKAIQNELYRNIGLAFLSVAIMTLVLIANFITSFFICACVVLTVVDVGGLMYFWDLNIDTVTSIILIIALGLSIDFSAHIGHTFMTTKGNRTVRIQRTLTLMGPAVFFGGFSTFLAFILLVFSYSYVFQTFFKVFLGVVVFGLFHGLALLPVILSLIGPRPYKTAHHEPEEADDADIGRKGWNDSVYIPPQFWDGVRRGSPPSRSDRSQGPLSSGNSGDTGVYSAGHLYRTRLQEERSRMRNDHANGYSATIFKGAYDRDYIPRGRAHSTRQYGGPQHPGDMKPRNAIPPLRVYVKPSQYHKPDHFIKPSKRKSQEDPWPPRHKYPSR